MASQSTPRSEVAVQHWLSWKPRSSKVVIQIDETAEGALKDGSSEQRFWLKFTGPGAIAPTMVDELPSTVCRACDEDAPAFSASSSARNSSEVATGTGYSTGVPKLKMRILRARFTSSPCAPPVEKWLPRMENSPRPATTSANPTGISTTFSWMQRAGAPCWYRLCLLKTGVAKLRFQEAVATATAS